MLKIKQVKCNDILHTDLQQANGQSVFIFFLIYYFSGLEIVATYEN